MVGWGARIRTWDRGTKTRCLTAWLRPTAASIGTPRGAAGCSRVGRPSVFFAVGEEDDEAADGNHDDRDDRDPLRDEEHDRHQDGEQLRGREDPRELACRGRRVLAAEGDV